MPTRAPSTQCLRLLRSYLREETRSFKRTTAPARRHGPLFTTALPRRQKARNSGPPVQPTAVGTATSNVTTARPTRDISSTKAAESAAESAAEPSIAEMQRVIAGSLRPKPLMTTIAERFVQSGSSTVETYLTYGFTEKLFNACSAQADYTVPEEQRASILSGTGPPKTADGEDLGVAVTTRERDAATGSTADGQTSSTTGDAAAGFWFAQIGLPPTFSTWSQVTYLHMYLLTVRLRGESSATRFRNQHRYLLEHFSNAAEEKMALLHGMSARGIRNRYLKDLFLQWRGILVAYDEGLVQGDAVLAGAVWRNLFKGRDDVDWVKVACVVAYIRRMIDGLAAIEHERDLVAVMDGTDKARLIQQARMGLVADVGRASRGIAESLDE